MLEINFRQSAIKELWQIKKRNANNHLFMQHQMPSLSLELQKARVDGKNRWLVCNWRTLLMWTRYITLVHHWSFEFWFFAFSFHYDRWNSIARLVNCNQVARLGMMLLDLYRQLTLSGCFDTRFAKLSIFLETEIWMFDSNKFDRQTISSNRM